MPSSINYLEALLFFISISFKVSYSIYNNDSISGIQAEKHYFRQRHKKGAAVILNNEIFTNQAIKIELNQLELKLKQFDAKLMSEKEDLQT